MSSSGTNGGLPCADPGQNALNGGGARFLDRNQNVMISAPALCVGVVEQDGTAPLSGPVGGFLGLAAPAGIEPRGECAQVAGAWDARFYARRGGDWVRALGADEVAELFQCAPEHNLVFALVNHIEMSGNRADRISMRIQNFRGAHVRWRLFLIGQVLGLGLVLVLGLGVSGFNRLVVRCYVGSRIRHDFIPR